MRQNALLVKAISQDILGTGETQMRKRSSNFQIKKEHLVAFSVPVCLRSFEKNLACDHACALVIHAEKYSIWMWNLKSDEWDLCVFKKVSHFRPNTLIRLKLDGEINARLYQMFCILECNFDTVSILDLNQIYWP